MVLGRPLLVPAGLGFLGSFGAITSIRSQLPNRQGPFPGTLLQWGCPWEMPRWSTPCTARQMEDCEL